MAYYAEDYYLNNNMINKEEEDIQREKYDQINEYYYFKNNINRFFLEGINKYKINEKQKLYFIDLNWIKKWKIYSNYDKVVENIKMSIDNLKKKKFLTEDLHFPYTIESGNSENIFLNKLIYTEKDFNYLINNSTYKSFYHFHKHLFDKFWPSLNYIEGMFYEDMIVLLINKQKRIKIIYKGDTEEGIKFIQLSLDFIVENKINNENEKKEEQSFFSWFSGKKNKDNYDKFIDKYINENNSKLKNMLIKICAGYISEQRIEEEDFSFQIYNNILYKKYILSQQNLNISQLTLNNNINNPRIIGLKNIGATCYMNATLQCFLNIDFFTRYLLIPNNFYNILDNSDKSELLSCYVCLLEKLCCDENINDYYSPKAFKEIISSKNPLFKGVQANDSKDLIYFLLEQMNEEFNQINLKINNILNFNDNEIVNNEQFQDNEILMLNNFIKKYSFNNNNIIPKLFYSIIENENICQSCNTHKYNFEVIFSLDFPLQKIYNKIYGPNSNINNTKKLSLYECFSNYNETNYFKGENSIYCNVCKSQQNSIYINKIYSLSPILIIILNRDKGNIFKCHVDFPENINVQKYIQNPKSSFNYSLIGVISHLGSSDIFGHFIAYCRHRITKDWYCYNDSTVTLCKDQLNDFKKGVPYILFYESTDINKNILFDNDCFMNSDNKSLNSSFSNFLS